MTGGKDAQDKQDNKELFPEPVQPKEQAAADILGDKPLKDISEAAAVGADQEPTIRDLIESGADLNEFLALQEEFNEQKKQLAETIKGALSAQNEAIAAINQIGEKFNKNFFESEPAAKAATKIGDYLENSLSSSFSKVFNEATNTFAAAIMTPAISEKLSGTFAKAAASFLEWELQEREKFFLSAEWETMKKEFPGITEDNGADLYFCNLVNPIIDNLQGFKQKIAEYEKANNCKLSFADLLNTEDAKLYKGLTLAERFLDELGVLDTGNGNSGAADQDQEQEQEEPQRAIIKRAANIDYPVDKINSIVWGLLEKDTRGQISFNLAKRGSEKKILAYYAINFDDLGENLTITKRLLPFDKRVYIAISALFNAGNNVITLSQIYYAMGYTGNPGTRNLNKINDAITKMTGARIFVDNKQEAAEYKYKRFKYDGSLLPIERGTAIVNGKLSEAVIHIFREPPLMSFARQRKQITSVDIALLQSPISKTDANLQIEDYLLERISKDKNSKKSGCRILFKTLYSHTGIADKPKTNTERQQKKRAPGKIENYLKHYQKTGFITGYTMEKDGISIFFE